MKVEKMPNAIQTWICVLFGNVTTAEMKEKSHPATMREVPVTVAGLSLWREKPTEANMLTIYWQNFLHLFIHLWEDYWEYTTRDAPAVPGGYVTSGSQIRRSAERGLKYCHK
jgi:hypothetical protein